MSKYQDLLTFIENNNLQAIFKRSICDQCSIKLIEVLDSGEFPTILEIGASNGYTSLLFKFIKPGSSVFSIDIVKSPELVETIKHLNHGYQFIQGDSSVVHELNTKFDLVLIDAGHTYDCCLFDWENVKPYLNEGATVFFHDLDHPAGCGKVFYDLKEYDKEVYYHPESGVPLWGILRNQPPNHYTVSDDVNHITKLWDGGEGYYSRQEDLCMSYFQKLMKFYGGTVLEIGPGTGQFAMKLLKAYPISKYTVLDLKKNIYDSMRTFSENGITGEFIESANYEQLFGRRFDLIVSNFCLSEVPSYYREDIFKNILPNCESAFFIDGDAKQGNFNAWIQSSLYNNFETLQVEDIGKWGCFAMTGQNLPKLVLGKGLQPYVDDQDAKDPTVNLESLEKEFVKIPGLKGVVLDVGCGNARLNILHSKRFDKVIGLDIFREPNPKYVTDNFKYLPIGIHNCYEQVDVVLFVGTFYLHCDGYLQTIRKAKSLLNAGGRIVIMDDASRDSEIEKPGYYNLSKICSELNLKIIQKERQETGKYATYVLQG